MRTQSTQRVKLGWRGCSLSEVKKFRITMGIAALNTALLPETVNRIKHLVIEGAKMENMENIVLKHLRVIRSDIENIKADIGEIKLRLGSIEMSVGNIHTGIAILHSRADRLDSRVERIEKRLELTTA